MLDKDNSFFNQCKKNLIDTTARNNLIHFKFTSQTSLDIDKLSQFQKNKKNQNQSFEIEKIDYSNTYQFNLELAKNSIINSAPDENKKLQQELHKTLEKIYLKQKQIKDEKGFNPTSWAYYFFKYQDGNKQKYAPIYLISTEVVKNKKGSYAVNHPSIKPLINFNYAIYEKFKNDFQITIDNKLIDFKDLSNASLDDIDQKISQIEEFLAENIKGVSIEKKIILGIFNSAKASLYNELVNLEKYFLNHNLIKIFLTRDFSKFNRGDFQKPYKIDKIPSDKFFSPFDFDSSQLEAIQAAKDGKNFIIQGPPGTGKTQTISNIISELVAEGKKVLFVAEKKAAIDAVLKNFSKIGLEKIFLDLHDKKSKSRDIVDQMFDSITFFQDHKHITLDNEKLLKLDETKKKLNERSEILHEKLEFDKTPFDLNSELTKIQDIKKLGGNFLYNCSKENFDKYLKTLEDITKLLHIYLDSNNPFLDKKLKDLKNFLENNKELKSLTELKNLINDTKDIELTLLSVDKHIKELRDIIKNFSLDIKKFNKDELESIFYIFKKALSNNYLLDSEPNKLSNLNLFNIKDCIKETQKLLIKSKTLDRKQKKLKLFINQMINNSSFKNIINYCKKAKIEIDLKKLSKEFEINKKTIIKKINLITQSQEIADLWQLVNKNEHDLEYIESVIKKYFKDELELKKLKDDLTNGKRKINILSNSALNYLDENNNTEINLDYLENKVSNYIKYFPELKDSISYLELKNTLEELSLQEFWEDFLQSTISHKKILDVFKKSFYSQNLEKISKQNELISNTIETSKIRDNFKILDKASIEINKNRVIKNINQHLSNTVDKYSSDFRELKYLERLPKPRKILSKYRNIILNAVRCVVCSPLTICEYFEINEKHIDEPIFDVVIFDEASQIFISDALSSIFRAKQIIIAGDSNQMPPTNLFNNKDTGEDDNDSDSEEDNNEEDINDYLGLLSYSATKLPEISLNWHYRSNFEQLIYPSNKFVYSGRLITFPNSNKTEKPIVFHYLPEGIWQKQTNDHEAKYVIELLKKIYDTGARSVGVISINSKQQELIRSLIYCNTNLNDWLDSDDGDGLFVKNLENCQGDERDIVIICSSYAKNKEGKIDGRMFQQLNSENSYKRLNVMFSRAKQKIHLLSSLKYQDIKNDGTKKGMDFFQKYLQFAETSIFGITSKNHIKQDDFDSGFEESVCKSLRSLGYEIHSQVGCSGYKIDLAVVCPNTKNYILGIECDGEMYHSGKTARERDRLRQEVLESKGWNIHRIWSYDWIDSKNEELEKLQKKINQLIIQ